MSFQVSYFSPLPVPTPLLVRSLSHPIQWKSWVTSPTDLSASSCPLVHSLHSNMLTRSWDFPLLSQTPHCTHKNLNFHVPWNIWPTFPLSLCSHCGSSALCPQPSTFPHHCLTRCSHASPLTTVSSLLPPYLPATSLFLSPFPHC